MTSTVEIKDENRARPVQKAKVPKQLQLLIVYTNSYYKDLISCWDFLQIEIMLGKTGKFDELMAAAASAAAEQNNATGNGAERS